MSRSLFWSFEQFHCGLNPRLDGQTDRSTAICRLLVTPRLAVGTERVNRGGGVMECVCQVRRYLSL